MEVIAQMYGEGRARIEAGEAFLNPQARFSRDLSVALVSLFAKKSTKILDPTAATGIRGIRYYLETKSKDITLLEINRRASLSARKNIRANRVNAKVINKSMQEFANTTKERFDVIDLDPFGSVAPDLFDVLKISKDGTYLFLTATDMAVLCGAHEQACLKIYDAKPMHNELCHEVAARILIGFAARMASQFNFGVEAVLSLSYAHYLRVILRLRQGADAAKDSIKQLGYAYYCEKCGYRNASGSTFPSERDCKLCGYRLLIAGKLWSGQLYDKKMLKRATAEFRKRKFDEKGLRMLNTIAAEIDTPLYYSIPKITKKMGLPAISPILVMDSLKQKGIPASRTHFEKDSIRTSADITAVKKEISRLTELSNKV